MKEKEIGEITHYYPKINVGIVSLSDNLTVGDEIKIRGHLTEFDQRVDSIEIDHHEIKSANKNDVIGIKVNDRVREGDKIYIIQDKE